MHRLKQFIVTCPFIMAIAIRTLAEDGHMPVQLGSNAAELSTNDVVTQGQRVFTCAHSFHDFVPNWLKQIVESAGIKDHEIVGISSISGSRIIQHWDVPEDRNGAKIALRASKVDVLTLSPLFTPDIGISAFAQLAFEYNPNIRITVQESWLRSDFYAGTGCPADFNSASIGQLLVAHSRFFVEMDQYVSDLNKRLGKPVLFVVPAGQAVIALRSKIINGQAPGLQQQADRWQ